MLSSISFPTSLQSPSYILWFLSNFKSSKEAGFLFIIRLFILVCYGFLRALWFKAYHFKMHDKFLHCIKYNFLEHRNVRVSSTSSPPEGIGDGLYAKDFNVKIGFFVRENFRRGKLFVGEKFRRGKLFFSCPKFCHFSPIRYKLSYNANKQTF